MKLKEFIKTRIADLKERKDLVLCKSSAYAIETSINELNQVLEFMEMQEKEETSK